MSRRSTLLASLALPSRRQVFQLFGLTVLVGCAANDDHPDPSAGAGADGGAGAAPSASGCLPVTETTRGPHFADERADPNIAGDFG